jgi:hypothetical protein
MRSSRRKAAKLLGTSFCYLNDLFTAQAVRGALIHAQRLDVPQVYWLTHETNAAAQELYNKVADRPGFILHATGLPTRDGRFRWTFF